MPCAVVATGEKGACFTCRMGKMSCSLTGKRKKAGLDEGEVEEEGEFELRIIQKTVKKGAEDGEWRNRFERKPRNRKQSRTS